MKKKLIASLLAASMLLTLSACGKDSGTPDSKPASATDSEQVTDSGPATDAPDETAADNANKATQEACICTTACSWRLARLSR